LFGFVVETVFNFKALHLLCMLFLRGIRGWRRVPG
jgi:hypothetical protein